LFAERLWASIVLIFFPGFGQFNVPWFSLSDVPQCSLVIQRFSTDIPYFSGSDFPKWSYNDVSQRSGFVLRQRRNAVREYRRTVSLSCWSKPCAILHSGTLAIV